ncbi:sensor histidine kinase [Sanguibacter sp. A247]|uniref:sensor histidine kinase n=1 Tax=unclassified Sanguibacter TaxID=2645534 RepID=UPI003FD8CD97
MTGDMQGPREGHDVDLVPDGAGRERREGVRGVLLSVAGTGAYLMPAVAALLPGAGSGTPLWWCAYLVGLAAFVLLAIVGCERALTVHVAAFVLVGAAAAVYLLDAGDGVGGVPLVVAAATVGLTLPWHWVVVTCVASVAVIAVGNLREQDVTAYAVILTTMYAGLVLFAATTGYSSAAERRLRERHAHALAELTVTHRALQEARDDLAEASRAAERLRISRELHDLVGHQLAGLAVHLEVAAHLTEGQAQSHVEAARGAAKSLLADVRTVVATLRDDAPTDLGAALAAVADAVPHPRVVLVAEGVDVLEPAYAHVVLRCVQEAVTNAVRHAQAERVDVRVRVSPTHVHLAVRDDGRGAPSLVEGHGLRGMRERVTALGGSVAIEPGSAGPGSPGLGVLVRVEIPLGGARSGGAGT